MTTIEHPDVWVVVQVRRHVDNAGQVSWLTDGAAAFRDEMEAHCAAELIQAIPDCTAYLLDLTPDTEPTIEHYGECPCNGHHAPGTTTTPPPGA